MKNFSKQFKECVDKNIAKIDINFDIDSYFYCTKYNRQCKSKTCLWERLTLIEKIKYILKIGN